MRINVLQHTPNEGPGAIQSWAHDHGHDMYIYHPYQFGNLPTAKETDLLVILGGPMSPNDDDEWIGRERVLIKQMLDAHKPILGICFGSQQIAKTLGYRVLDAPAKEVGWAPVYLQNHTITELPEKLTALHWHQQMSEIPREAKLLFSSDLVKNQGFLLGDNVIGLQFHFEPLADNVREMVVNDFPYIQGSIFNQTADDILETPVPDINRAIMFKILDFITADK